MRRRDFVARAAAAAAAPFWDVRPALGAEPFPVQFRKASAFDAARPLIDPQGDAKFPAEAEAARISAVLEKLVSSRSVPLTAAFSGASPLAAKWEAVAPDVERAVFPSTFAFDEGLRKWLDSLAPIETARFYPLAAGEVRFEVKSQGRYATGRWRMSWRDGKLERFAPVEETRVRAAKPWFEDVTSQHFGSAPSFASQLRFGVPYWRARLDAATGIDVYGNNGVAVGDIDGDGWDEIYVCQPGGLPNRLFRRGPSDVLADITESAGVGILDDTACALFLDLRNIGRQDLVVLTTAGPLLFLNQRNGKFAFKAEAFRSPGAPQGTFTGMAAADYDRDGKVDLYLCTYIYFQSEDQYRYPTPYHDARNGPPNYLFRNRLEASGEGYFEDTTAAAGLAENNNRYSFAPAWCDFDGDGWPDLYVANDFGRNNLYRNEGGRFRDIAEQASVADLGPGMSAAWFDYDGDSRPDLYVANMWTASGQRVAGEREFAPVAQHGLRDEYRRHSKGNSLYRNAGQARFEDPGASQGVELGRWAWSADGVDFDNDGAPEIYVTCGMLTGDKQPDLMSYFWRRVVAESPSAAEPAEPYEQGWNNLNQWIREGYHWNGFEPNVFYARRGGVYHDFSGVSGLDLAADSRAFAVTDLDGDGALDVIVKCRLGPQVRAFRNRVAARNRVIALDLEGTQSNRDAIGARVDVTHAGGTVTRWLAAGSGYLSQHTKRVFVGLGKSTRADSVKITWPSGAVQEFTALDAGFRYKIVEGNRSLVARTAFTRAAGPVSTARVSGDDTPSFADAWLLEPIPSPVAAKGPGVLCVVNGATRLPASLHVVDLATSPPELAAAFAILRRYLFDYRDNLKLPFALLVDGESRVHRVYTSLPSEVVARADLAKLSTADRQKLALPFAGRYYSLPGRNLYRFAAALLAAGYPSYASPYLDAVLAKSPDNFKALLAAGQSQLETDHLPQARGYLEKALALNPNSAEVLNNLGGVAMAESRFREAAGYFDKALAERPGAAFLLANAGQAYARAGDHARAESLLRQALEAAPADADAAHQLGLLLARQGRLESAKEMFQRAITHQRNHAGAINNLAIVYIQEGKANDAIGALTYGRQVAPGDENICMNLARIFMQSGERDKAIAVLRECAAANPSNETVKRALAAVER